jgi:3,4-dihydroxy 2-butanone 4-phosphate synthase/GTP cyclohydrolase II
MGNFNTIEEAILAIKNGEQIILINKEGAELVGSLVCAAEHVSPEIINQMASIGKGLICTAIERKRAEELDLNKMTNNSTDGFRASFTVSIDLIGQGCTTGISTYDRATCIKAMVDPASKSSDFARPGHIFPLIAKEGGVLRRVGQTEATIDLARLSGCYPAGVLVKILKEDGSLAQLSDLLQLAKDQQFKIISIDDLIAYRLKKERLIEKVQTTKIDSIYGPLELIAFKQLTNEDIHIVIKKGNWKVEEPILVRVHSSSESIEFSQLFYNAKATILQKSMAKIVEEGKGIVVFMRHKEKETSILNQLSNLGNVAKGGVAEKKAKNLKDYGVGAQIISALDITKIKLITNKTKLSLGLAGYGLEIVEQIEL